jgi:hypothetical protein
MFSRSSLLSGILLWAAVASPAFAQFTRQTALVPTNYVGSVGTQNVSTAISGDGNTVILGENGDNNYIGAAWIFVRCGHSWCQQAKLIGTAVGQSYQGNSVALSADGNTALIGGPGDNGYTGAAWVFTRTAGVWTQQAKLVGPMAGPAQARSVAISADGTTALVEADGYNNAGAAFVFVLSGGAWTLQATLTGNDATGNAAQGGSVSLSGDGNTALLGVFQDNNSNGAAWVFTRTGSAWTQQGPKLVGTGGTGPSEQGWSVALSNDGNTALSGGPWDNNSTGAVWVFTRSNATWSQEARLVEGATSVALSADGNTSLGGMLFVRTGVIWALEGTGLLPFATGETALQSAAIANDANTIVVAAASGTTAEAVVFQRLPTHFSVSAPPSALTGNSANVIVTAQDSSNNTVTNYTGTVHFTSTDTGATLPADTQLTNGTGTFPITFATAGTQTVTVTDTAIPSLTGTSGSVLTSGPATHFTVNVPSSAVSGLPFFITVTALDANNHTAGSYTGTVHLTSNDSAATLPNVSISSSGLGSVAVTLVSINTIFLPGGSTTYGPAGIITATDANNSGITGASIAVTVYPAAALKLKVTAPPTATAGTATSATITLVDNNLNPVAGYSTTLHVTSSDTAAILPANLPLVNGSATCGLTFQTTGSQTLSLADVAAATINGSTSVAVGAGAATRLNVVAPAGVSPATSFHFTVTAQDTLGNTATGYSGIVHFASSDFSATLPANAALTNGTGMFSATLVTGGNQTITATDPINSTITGTSGAIIVAPLAATHFSVTGLTTATAGTAASFTVTALDTNNAKVSGYSGTVHFTSTDSSATLPANATLTNGTGSFSVTFITAGSQTITATDTVTTSITGVSSSIAVSGAAAVKLKVSAPASATAGTAFNFTVTAQDTYGNTAATYAGTVHFTSTDSVATLPANGALANGTATFSATLATVANATITATDMASSSITGVSASIAVSAGAAAKFRLTAPATITAGASFNVTVTAQDASGNTATGYGGTVHFTSDDSAATLPADMTLTHGAATVSVKLATAGSHTITATDTVTAATTGSSAAVAVTAAAATHLAVAAPASTPIGSAFNITVTALDAFNNTAKTYAGTVHFTSTDPGATLPANTALTNGTATLSATLATAGSRTITATDTVTSTITGVSSAIIVGGTTATHFSVTAAATAAAGSSVAVTVTALDANNVVVPGYSGTVHFTSSDPSATLPADTTLTNGTATKNATPKTAGSQTFTATDTVTAAITGTSSAVTISPAAAARFKVAAPTGAYPGAAFNFTVTAQDAFGNTAAVYTGTVHFATTDTAGTVPVNSVLTNGTGTFLATMATVGSQTITATDTVSSSITGTTSAIAVATLPATHFSVSAPSAATASAAISVIVTALDANNSLAAGYSGTVHFTSSDSAATLPADAKLTAGTGTFSVTLKTASSQTLTATDTVSASIAGVSGAIIVAAGAPTVGGVAPAAGSGFSPTLVFTFSDPRGWQDLDVVNILINNFLDGRAACYLAYSRPLNTLYLVNDAGTALMTGMALNGSGSTANSQCGVMGANSFATGAGNTLTLTLNMMFSASWMGNRVMYLAARDLEGGNSGWQPMGAWNVPGTPWTGPWTGSITPPRSSGSGGSFTFTFDDPKGYTDLGVVNILINSALDGRAACYLAYSRTVNTLYLVNDAGTALLTGLNNSQCSVSGFSASGSGNVLTLTMTIAFTSSFDGNRMIYMAARDTYDGNNSGWQAMGSVTVQ